MPSILVVCTGNICRTPLAEGFLKEHLRRRFPHQPIDVSGAGVIARDGHPATEEAVAAAWEREVDISSHRARRLHPNLVAGADLALGMAEEHAEEMRRMVPDASWRIFTLKELISLLKDLPPVEGRETLDGGEVQARLREADEHRGRRGVASLDLDVSDPLGMSIDTYRATAWELDTLLGQLVEGLAGKMPARSSMWDED
jgi:low molecular weight protein-tyrosine phosphatase